MKEFIEKEAVAAMRSALPADRAAELKGVDADEFLNVIDMIWDWYEDNGLLEIDPESPDDEEISTATLMKYVEKMLKADKDSPFTASDVEYLVNGELAYEQSLEED